MTAIDGLRGLAALAVVVYHYLNFFRYGPGSVLPPGELGAAPFSDVLALFYYHGHRAVPLFWMISGLVLAHVYCGRASTGGAFAVNRLARLYPLHLLTLMVVAALQTWALVRLGMWPVYSHNDGWHFALNLLFASNWGFERGYSFNGPIWSVSVEMLAYILFWMIHRQLLRWGTAIPLAISSVALIVIAVFGDSDGARCAFYFFIGTGLAGLLRGFAGSFGALAVWAASLIVIGLAALFVAFPGFTQFVGLPALFGGAILALSLRGTELPGWLARPCAALGDWSYGIYLWHFPLQLALIVVLAPWVDLPELARQGWFFGCYLLLVLFVAYLSFTRFERPWRARLRRWGDSVPPRDSVKAVGAGP